MPPTPSRRAFSFKALLLAPLPVPAVVAALFAFGPDVKQPLLGFLFIFAFGLLISIPGTLALAAVLRLLPTGRTVAAATGAILALLVYLPFAWVMWKSSGPDSGPPTEPFLTDLLRPDDLGLAAVFLVSGLVTALCYDALTRRFNRPKATTINP